MALTTASITSDGDLVLWELPIDYLNRTDLTFSFDDVEVPEGSGWSWMGSTGKSVAFDPAVPAGVVVRVVRTTDVEEALHIYGTREQGGSAQFTAQSVDENQLQVLYAAQEMQEQGIGRAITFPPSEAPGGNVLPKVQDRKGRVLTFDETTGNTEVSDLTYAEIAAGVVTAGGLPQLEARALKAPPGETLLDLPSAEDRAGKVLLFDAEGQPALVTDPGSATQLRADLADAADPTKGAAMVGYNEYQTVWDHLSDVVTFEQFGAGTGLTDDAALERLVTYLNSRSVGCVVRFDGNYKFTVPCPVVLTRSGVLLGGRGTFDMTEMALTNGTYLIRAEGPGFTGAATTLTADWKTTYVYDTNGRGIQIAVASTAGFSAGDYVTITSTEYYGGAAMSGFRTVGKGRLRRIRAVIDSTHLALDEGPNDSFDAVNYTVTVRGLRLLEGLAVHDLNIIGPYETIGFEATDVAGPAFLHGLYVQGYLESGVQARNFQTSVTQLEMSDTVTIRDNIYKGAWGGCRVFSVRRPSFLNVDYECGRRPQDWDSRYRPFAGVTDRQEVQTEHVQVIGGFTRNAVSGIGGHIAHFVTAVGVTVRDVNVGYHNRGMHNTIIGCDIVARTSAVTLGLGSSAMEDISTYDEYPVNSGNTYIDSTTKLRAESRGVYVTASWGSFQCDAYIEARNALMAFGKSLSNARITANFKGTAPDATYGGYCIGLGPTLPNDANNIRVQGGQISSTNRAVWHKGAQTTVTNFRVDGVHFDDVNTYYVRADIAGFDAATCSVTNCTHTGALASSPVGGVSNAPVRPLLWESNNSWARNVDRSNVTAGNVSVVSSADYVVVQVAPATSETVSTISGKGTGQLVSLRNAGPGTLSVTHSGNIRLNGGVSLSAAAAGSIVTLVCVNSTGTQWAEISRQIAP